MAQPLKRLAVVATLAMLCRAQPVAGDEIAWSDARQIVLVTTSDWNSTQGVLTAFDYADSQWKRMHGPAPVAIGRSGSAWGAGLHPPQSGPKKQEGDGRSPAGVFRIGEAFGYAQSARTALPYEAMSDSDYCIDVSGSPLYNRIVDAREVGEAAVKGSTEPMRRDIHAGGDVRYALGFVIEHNKAARPQGGSCIFAHLWRTAGEPTSGCTSMDESLMRGLLAWLDPAEHPVFVLLPEHEYARLADKWRLPSGAGFLRTNADVRLKSDPQETRAILAGPNSFGQPPVRLKPDLRGIHIATPIHQSLVTSH